MLTPLDAWVTESERMGNAKLNDGSARTVTVITDTVDARAEKYYRVLSPPEEHSTTGCNTPLGEKADSSIQNPT